VRSAGAVAAAIREDAPGSIYHLAGVPHVGHAWADVVPHLEANVLGTHHVLEGVRLARIRCRILVISSALVYAPGTTAIDETRTLCPATPYGMSKLAQEQLALRAIDEDGLQVLVARPFNHVGPRQDPNFAVSSFARQIALIEAGRAQPVIRVGNLDASRDMTDVRDVVDAYVRIMASGAVGRPYNVCSGRAVRMGEILDQLLRFSRAKVTVTVDPALLRPTDPAVFIGDGSRIHAEIGWSPGRALSDTLREMLEFWRESVATSSFA